MICEDFDGEIMLFGKQKVKDKMYELEMLGNNMSVKEKGMYTVLELVNEMYERGYEFLPIDLYKSDAKNFKIEDRKNKASFLKHCRITVMLQLKIYLKLSKKKMANLFQ